MSACTTADTDLAWAGVHTPLGELSLACSPAGVARVSYGPPPAPPAPAPAPDDPPLLADARRQLSEYFAGRRRAFDLPVDLSGTSPLQRQVLSELAASVGYGETVTYSELAARAGVTASGQTPPARVVGQIMGANPCPVVVPCHRVVAGRGLGGYSGGAGVETKRWLLTFEGAIPATLDFDPSGMLR